MKTNHYSKLSALSYLSILFIVLSISCNAQNLEKLLNDPQKILDDTKSAIQNSVNKAVQRINTVIITDTLKSKANPKPISDCYYETSDKSDPCYFFNKGIEYEKQQNYSEAINCYTQAININPSNSEFYRKRGFSKTNSNDLDGALVDCEKALELNPDNSKAYNLRGIIRKEKKEYDAALQDYNKAVTIDPTYNSAFINMAFLKTLMGKNQEAIELLNPIIQKEPTNLNAYEVRAWAKLQMKDYLGAIDDYNLILEKDPNNYKCLNNRGLAKKNLDDIQGAIVDFKKSIEANPNYEIAVKNLEKTENQSLSSDKEQEKPDGYQAIKQNNQTAITNSPKPAGQDFQINYQLGSGNFKGFDPCKYSVTGTDFLWAVTPNVDVVQKGTVPSAAELNDLKSFAELKYENSVLMAKAAMKTIIGDVSIEQENAFEKKWAYYLNMPTIESKAYFDTVAPLLAKLVSAKNQYITAYAEKDAALSEAVEAIQWGNKTIETQDVNLAQRQENTLNYIQQDIMNIVANIEKLGNPPDPIKQTCDNSIAHGKAIADAIDIVEADSTSSGDKKIASEQIKLQKPAIEQTFDENLVTPFILGECQKDCKIYQVGIYDKDYDHYEFKYSISCPRDDYPASAKSIKYTVFKNNPRYTNSGGFKEYQAVVSMDIDYYRNTDNNSAYDLYKRTIKAAQGNPQIQGNKKSQAYILPGWNVEGVLITTNDLNEYDGDNTHWGGIKFTGITGNMVINCEIHNYVGTEIDEASYQAYLDQAEKDKTPQEEIDIVLKEFNFLRMNAAKKLAVKNEEELFNYLFSSQLKVMPHEFIKQVKEEPKDEADQLTPEQRIQIVRMMDEYFYKSNMRIIEANMQKVQEEFENERNTDLKNKLALSILGAKADISAEQDKINTLYTGEVTHTRTQWDEMAHQLFVQRIKDGQEKYLKDQRDVSLIRKEALNLPDGERETALAFIDKQITGKILATGDEATIKKVRDAIFNKTQGYRQLEAAKSEEESVGYDEYTTAAERVKTGADIAMTGTSLFGGPLIMATYDVTTGYIEGGIKEAVVKLALNGGFYALGKGMQAAGNVLNKTDEVANLAQKAAMTSEDLVIFNQRRKQGENIVKEFEALQESFQAAKKSKQSIAEIKGIQEKLRQKTIEINSNPNAKNYLKYNGDPMTQKRYISNIRSVHAEVEQEFYNSMKRKGWDDFKIKEFRNASSSGKVGMDYDIGLVENVKKADGTIVKVQLTKEGEQASVSNWQRDAEESWKQAYKNTTGAESEKAWETVTSSVNKEAYKDLSVLTGDMSNVSSEWIQQTADVTKYKANHMSNEAFLSKYEKFQEICRGTAKDVNTKLMPILESSVQTPKLKQTQEHWKQVSEIMENFGRNEIDPITAERKIAELTGGKSIPEVVAEMADMMESTKKLGKKGTSVYSQFKSLLSGN